MLKTLMNNANIWSEAQRTNVRWIILALAYLAAVLWLGAACGDDRELTPEEKAQAWAEQTEVWEECMSEDKEVTVEQAEAALEKYAVLFQRQPHWTNSSVGNLFDPGGAGFTDQIGIVVAVWEKTDQATLPEEDRIPDCVDGVPVQIWSDFEGELLEMVGGEE